LSSQQQEKRIVVIAGGGTGGHIYPGVAIARAVERLHPGIAVHFVGAKGGLEEKIVPREKFPLHTVPVGRLHSSVGFLTQLKTLVLLPLAFIGAVKILWRLKPVAVLGVGGFASGPMLFVSSLFGYRSLIWEPNAYPGLTNRLLSRHVNECLLVFEDAGRFLHARKLTLSGLPVRSAMVPTPRTPETNGGRPLRVLVFGGSQGSRFINNLVSAAVRADDWLPGIELVHQTGSLDFTRIKESYSGAPQAFQVLEYLHDMDQRYAWADLVVCRAGASTIAEICACQKAAILIPLPTAADDHQRKNAEVLEKADAALVFLQNDPKNELTPTKFRATLERFRDDRSLTARMEQNVRQFQFPNAAEKIVDRLLPDEQSS
jgi:UDP-N-acetylglucosamine--N-acetylmuramyl-(pentapeptide) pyrophosphoryl-undecaprenol N-acetylglucosamine transferase